LGNIPVKVVQLASFFQPLMLLEIRRKLVTVMQIYFKGIWGCGVCSSTLKKITVIDEI
jgi:hypothetical protein